MNAGGQETAITDPDGNVTQVRYDSNGYVATVQNTLGTWTFQNDAHGNVTQVVSPTGVTRTLSYVNNAVTSDTAIDSSGNTIEAATFQRNTAGQATSETDASGTYGFTYTVGGQMASETLPSGLTLNYHYDTNNHLIQVTDSAGGETDYTWDAQNQLTQEVFLTNGQPTLVVVFTYTSGGDVATETRYSDLAQTVPLGSTHYAYNTNHQDTELQELNAGGQVFEDYVYTYNGTGQLTSEQLNGLTTACYTYDAQGQVLSDGSRVYTYDANGNRTLAGYVIGADNALQSGGTWNYQFDQAGQVIGKVNITTGESWAYVYALNGHLAQATDTDGTGHQLQQVNYVYNPAGQVVEEDVTTPTGGTQVTKYVWSGTQLYATLDANGNVTNRFFTVNGSNQLLGSADANGQLSQDLTDPLGSVRDVVGPNGSVHANYDAFGNTTNGSVNIGLFGWGGLLRDAATGLYQGTLAREYDPSTGRWTSPDPAGLTPGVTNLYVYANNQTTSRTDVTGLFWLEDAWNATSSYVSNAASSAAQAVANAFRTVTTAAGNFAASALEQFQSGVNQVTWLVKQGGEQLLILGNQAVDATLGAAKNFMTYLDKFGRSFNDLWAQLQKFGDSAKTVLQAIVNDPITFFKNLAAGVGQGIKDFITNIGSTLKDALLNWLGGSTWQNLAAILPSSWTDPKAVGQFLLDFFSLGWNSIQNTLINTLGASNIALVTQLYTEMQQFIAKGTQGVFAWLETAQAKLDPSVLVQKAIDAGVQYVIENLVPKALEYIAQLLPIPGPQVLVQIYNTVDWIFNSLGKFQQLAQIATEIVGQIGAVVQGQTSVLAGQIKNLLNGLVPVGITFLAGQLGIGNLPGELSAKIATLQNYPLSLVQQGVKYLADKAKELLGLNSAGQAPEGLVGHIHVFYIGGRQHRIWTVVTGTGATMLMATTPTNITTLHPEAAAAAAVATAQAVIAHQATQGQHPNPAAAAAAANVVDQQAGVAIQAVGGTANPEVYTPDTEPAAPDKDWSAYLQGLGKDALGKLRSDVAVPDANGDWRWKDGLGKGVKVHAHHIVMKNKFDPEGSFDARQILWKYDINPYTSVYNLVWAPNWSHSKQYAIDVFTLLDKVKNKGKATVIETLKQIAQLFIKGRWSSKGGGDVTGNDD